MIDPASAFCVGVYFLGVGVVGSVLYIPISLMRAIEHYHLRRDGGKGKGNDSLDGDYLSLYGNGNGESSGNSNSQSSDDNSSLFHERPELLLIHKKKVLRNILNDNNCYLSNLVDLDERSDHSFGVCERFTTYQTSVTRGGGGGVCFGASKSSRSEFGGGGSSRRYLAKKYSPSVAAPHDQETGYVATSTTKGGIDLESARDVLSTTTPSSDNGEDDDQSGIVLCDEFGSLPLKFCQQIGLKKGGDVAGYYANHSGGGAYTCSTNSTSSLMSFCEMESRRNAIFGTKKGGESNSSGSFFGSDSMSRYDGSHDKQKRGGRRGDDRDYASKVEELTIMEEISAVHDILAL